jgi:hypothetical protein
MIFKASYPLAAVMISKPSSESRPLNDWSMEGSSSTIKIEGNISFILVNN